MRAIRSWLILMVPVVLSACGSAQMTPVSEPPTMRQGDSMIVFTRPSSFGGPVAASVFDVTGSETKFVGLLNRGTKYAHPLKPGEYTFMVVGESADFMRATVAAGRTYYALVTPHWGVWTTRFSFRPVRDIEIGSAEFNSWTLATSYVENSPATLSWAADNKSDIDSKRAQYWPEWNAKYPHPRGSQALLPQDGTTGAPR